MVDINSINVSGTTYSLSDSVARNKVTTGTAVPTTAGSAGDLYIKNTPQVPEGYIAIGTPDELVAFATRVNAGENTLNACLASNIDMSGVSFASIGTNNVSYAGTFNGNGHTISNITISNSSVTYMGLFGRCVGATIEKVVCDSFNLTGFDDVGCLIGSATNCNITNCYAKNCTTSATWSNGGLSGFLTDSTISNCYSYNCISSGGSGFVDSSNGSTFSNCTVYGGNHGDTLIGEHTGTTITNCYTSSDVTSEVFHTQGFWDGTGVSGTTYLSWDFDDTWEWDSTNSLPKLQAVAVSYDTLLYAYNGSSWALQNTVLDATPTSASTNSVTSGGVYTSLLTKQKTITVSTSEPTSSEGSDGDIWMVYTA